MAQQVSTWWASGRDGTEEMLASVELLDPSGAPFRSTESQAAPIYCTHATQTSDRSRSVWSTATAQFLIPWDADDAMLALIPKDPLAPLAPTSSTTFRLSAGFRNPYTGDEEMVYVGRYDIEDVNVTRTAEGIVIDLDGQDLTGRLDVADVSFPLDIPWGWRVVDYAKWLVTSAIPWMVFEEDASDATMARVVLDEQANRWSEITKALTSIGFEGLMDPSGEFMRLRNVPTTADVAHWYLDVDDVRTGDLVNQIAQQQSRSRVYNGVICKGENPNSTDLPVRGQAWVEDTSDPTHYIPGPPTQTNIGPRPFFLTSQYVRTTEQAQFAAEAELRRIRGLLQRIDLEIPTNPAINVGDVLFVSSEDIGILGRYVVQSTAFDLGAGRERISCEERRV